MSIILSLGRLSSLIKFGIWFACNTCNTSKSDKLPKKDYLITIVSRNEELAEESLLEDLMGNYNEKKLLRMYDYSIKNGYDVLWGG